MSIKKTIYLITMTIILCIMTLGYAALQERIDVEVEANIDSTYRVEITRVQEGTVEGDARSVSAPSYHDLTSTFNVGLTNDTDYITYTIEITNYSTVDVILNNTEITTTNNNMSFTKSGIRNGDVVLAGSTKTVTIKIKLDTETVGEQTGTITVMFDFTRLKGGLGEVQEDSYYSILPVDYRECEYIESTGTQYIDTGINPSSSTGIKIDFNISNYGTIFGSYSFGGNGYSVGDTRYWIRDIDKAYLVSHSLISISISINQRHYIEFNYNANKKIVIDGNTIDLPEPTSNLPTSETLPIFAFHQTTYKNLAIMKLYSFSMYEYETLIRNYIPALDDNGVPCLYDTVSGETFYNAGTGDFIYQLKE